LQPNTWYFMRKKTKPSKAKKDALEDKIDEEIAESFPASDPPAYMGGERGMGTPKRPKPKPIRRA
jgi:hypothetical protein